MGFETLKYLGFMFFLTVNIDFMRQKHMKYRIKTEVDRKKQAELGLPDYSKLPLSKQLEIFSTLGTLL